MITRKITSRKSRRFLIFVLFLIAIVYYFLTWSALNHKSLIKLLGIYSTDPTKNKMHGCNIPEQDVYSPELMTHMRNLSPLDCTNHSIIEMVIIEDGYARIDPDLIDEYEDVACNLTYIQMVDDRTSKLNTEQVEKLNISRQQVKLANDFFVVDCIIPSIKQNSSKIYVSITRDEQIVNRLMKKTENEFNLNVLFYGIESMSRSQFKRKLPNTYDALTKKYNATILKRYNIVGDGSANNLIPILTGKTESELPMARKNNPKAKYIDDIYPLIWNEYRKHGYVTLFAEDTPHVGLFTFRLKGFRKQPTDYYLRPFYLFAWNNSYFLKDDDTCYTDKPRHQIMLNWTREFYKVYGDVSNSKMYSFSFYTEISHEDLNFVQIADNDIVTFLEFLDQENVFNNSITILMGDHGPRFPETRSTLTGKYEERLPFFSFILPEWFAKRFPNAYQNLQINAETRLLTPFDIHPTVMTILTHFNKGKDTDKYVDYGSELPRSFSLFQYIPVRRTCGEASVERHWCTCLRWTRVDVNKKIVVKAAGILITFINELNRAYTNQCSTLNVKKITKAEKISPELDMLHYKKTKWFKFDDLSDRKFDKIFNESYQLELVASPSDAMYEATIHYNQLKDKFVVKESEISRINKYGDQDWCIHDKYPDLRKYCHCGNASAS